MAVGKKIPTRSRLCNWALLMVIAKAGATGSCLLLRTKGSPLSFELNMTHGTEAWLPNSCRRPEQDAPCFIEKAEGGVDCPEQNLGIANLEYDLMGRHSCRRDGVEELSRKKDCGIVAIGFIGAARACGWRIYSVHEDGIDLPLLAVPWVEHARLPRECSPDQGISSR